MSRPLRLLSGAGLRAAVREACVAHVAKGFGCAPEDVFVEKLAAELRVAVNEGTEAELTLEEETTALILRFRSVLRDISEAAERSRRLLPLPDAATLSALASLGAPILERPEVRNRREPEGFLDGRRALVVMLRRARRIPWRRSGLPTRRDLTVASLLLGNWPGVPRDREMTVAEVLNAEAKLLDDARTARRR